MIDLFSSLKAIVKIDSHSTDNNVFKMYYKCTFLILLASSIMTSSRQYFGQPITCTADESIVRVIDDFCWVHSTYTISNKVNGKVGLEVASPGVGPVSRSDSVLYQEYYKWVWIVLFVQALFFYFPKLLWRAWEDGLIKTLIMDLHSPILEEAKKREQKRHLVKYFVTNWNMQNGYALKFFICEVLNLLNLVLQAVLTDMFLGYQFSTYGWDAIKMTTGDLENDGSPLDRVFPKQSKCTYHKFGFGGNIVAHDSLCVLKINSINDKIFIFLWVWYVILFTVSSLFILYRVATIFINKVRYNILSAKCHLSDKVFIQAILKKCQVGDWFVLTQLSKNIDPVIFKECLEELHFKLETQCSVLQEAITLVTRPRYVRNQLGSLKAQKTPSNDNLSLSIQIETFEDRPEPIYGNISGNMQHTNMSMLNEEIVQCHR